MAMLGTGLSLESGPTPPDLKAIASMSTRRPGRRRPGEWRPPGVAEGTVYPRLRHEVG
jgi:hypothetical protein